MDSLDLFFKDTHIEPTLAFLYVTSLLTKNKQTNTNIQP